MKKLLTILAISCQLVIASQMNAQICGSWAVVGTPGFSPGVATYTQIGVFQDTAYVAYSDGNAGGAATVVKFNGTTWVNVGNPDFTPGSASYISLGFDSIPTIAFSDGSVGGKATVMQYTSGAWQLVGTEGFSAGVASYTSLAFTGLSIPYVGYEDAYHSDSATVMEYTGGAWTAIPYPDIAPGTVAYTSMAGGTGPYLGFSDGADTNKATVMKYNGSTWSILGTEGFGINAISSMCIARGGFSNTYAAFEDSYYGNKASVMYNFGSSSWDPLDNIAFTPGTADYLSLAITPGFFSNAYVAYSDGANSGYASVMTQGSPWQNVGAAAFSAGPVAYTSIAMKLNLPYYEFVPWVAYEDGGNSNHLTVMKFQLLQDSMVYTNELCHGGTTATATVYPYDGNPPYSYLWSDPNAQTTQAATALSAGFYNVTITDNNGCSLEGFVSILQPATIEVTASTTSNVTCPGGTNGATSSTRSGGTSPYTYLWSDPNSQTTHTASGLSAGTYTITVSDSCGNTASSSTVVNQPAIIGISASTSSNVTCFGDNNGVASSTTSGGTTPFSYTWSPSGQTNSSASDLSAGTYTVTVSDFCGHSATATATITAPASAVSISIASQTNIECNGAATGSATANAATGGTPGYYYSWSTLGATGLSISGLSAGTYTITATDLNTCTGTAVATITQTPALIIHADSVKDNGTNNGVASVHVTGGVPPYTYLWSPTGSTTDSIYGLGSNTFCCHISDASGCTHTTCIEVYSTAAVQNLANGSNQITVYPNPNSGKFTIETPVGSGQLSIEIYNILGEQVYYNSAFNQQSTFDIDLSSQPDGIYLYRVTAQDGSLAGQGKLIIQK